MHLGAEEACEDNLDPQLDQGNKGVIKVTLLTFGLKREGQIGYVELPRIETICKHSVSNSKRFM